jgi:CheY-like chemotaxis protein
MDMNMPAMDGFELARQIKADRSIAGALLLMLSSAPRSSVPADYLSDGVAGLLVKPIRAEDLHDAITTLWREQGTEAARRLVTRHTIAEARAAARAKNAGSAAIATNGPVLHRKLSVLLAEDNVVNQKVASRMLAKLGCTVDFAANGADAVEMVGRSRYDLVFMDCQMPEMDGYEATRQIRERMLGAGHLPIVAMTANALQSDREACLEAGMDDYVAKPVRVEAIDAALHRWVPDRPEVAQPRDAATPS